MITVHVTFGGEEYLDKDMPRCEAVLESRNGSVSFEHFLDALDRCFEKWCVCGYPEEYEYRIERCGRTVELTFGVALKDGDEILALPPAECVEDNEDFPEWLLN